MQDLHAHVEINLLLCSPVVHLGVWFTQTISIIDDVHTAPPVLLANDPIKDKKSVECYIQFDKYTCKMNKIAIKLKP